MTSTGPLLPSQAHGISSDASSTDGGTSESYTPDTTRTVRFASARVLSVDTNHDHESLSSIYDSNDPRTPLLTPLRTPRSLSSLHEITTSTDKAVGRSINWSSAYVLIISRVIGSGIFATPGVIAQSTGSIGLSLLLWLIGAIISACGLAISLELGCMLPRSGGDKVYLEFIYDRPRYLASTAVAVQALLLGFTASNCIVFGKYMLFAFELEPTDSAQRAFATGLILCVTAIHGRSLRGGIVIQNALAWTKILVITFIAIAGLVVLLLQPSGAISEIHDRADPFSWSRLWEGSAWNFGSLATSFFKVSYAYSGFDNLNNVLDEVRNPRRTLKTAAPAAMITIFVFYMLLNVAYFVVVPLDEIKSSGELVAALFFNRILGPGIGARVLPVLIAFSAAGNVMVTTFAQARVNQEIARQGFLPFSKQLSSSRPYGTPLGGLLVHLVPSLAVILLPPPGAAYSFILEVKGYPAQITSLAIGVGLLWLRRRRPDLKRPFRASRLAVYMPVVLSCTLLLAPLFPSDEGKAELVFGHGTYAIVGIGTILIAVGHWFVWIRLLPWLGGYQYEEGTEVISDGTKISTLVRVPRSTSTHIYQSIDFDDDLGGNESNQRTEKPVASVGVRESLDTL